MLVPIRNSEILVRPAALSDADAVAGIYNYYVAETIVIFEEDPVPTSEMSRRIGEVMAESLPWLVAERAGAVAGYAYAAGWRKRRAYRFSVEVTVYIDPGQVGRGIGSVLYTQLLRDLRERGVRTALGGIALPNEASVALHEKFGFKKVAHLEQVGFKLDRWIRAIALCKRLTIRGL